MICVVQRVIEASVLVDGTSVGAIGKGLLALVAICVDDRPEDVQWTARKLTSLRLFAGSPGQHFDLDVRQAGGAVLLVSNFTVAAATRQGRRPSFERAANAQRGSELFGTLVDAVRAADVPVQTGQFGADMQVHLVNDGPVTVIIDSASPPPLARAERAM